MNHSRLARPGTVTARTSRSFPRSPPGRGDRPLRRGLHETVIYEDDGPKPYASVNFVTAHDGFTLRDLVDEIGRTQQGNNNAYCQDNEISWFDWDHVDTGLLEFTRRLVRLQAAHPVFRRRRWFKGRPVRGAGVSDIAWSRPDGGEMSEEDWQQPHARSFGVFLNGDALRERDEDGKPIRDDSFLLLFNGHHELVAFTTPAEEFGRRWRVEIDTAGHHESVSVAGGATLEVEGRSLAVLSRPRT